MEKDRVKMEPLGEAERFEAWFAHPEMRDEMDAPAAARTFSAEAPVSGRGGAWTSFYRAVWSAVRRH